MTGKIANSPPVDLPHVDVVALLDGLPSPGLLIDASRTVLAANQPARETLGIIRPGESISRSHPIPALLEAIDQVLANGKRTVRELQLSTTPPLICEASISALDIDGRRYLLIVLIDLTSVRQADVVRSAFVANVSHELRSPLTTLMGAAEALEGPAAGNIAGRSRMLALMGQEARRMKNLIDDLLSLSRVEAQEFIPPDQDVAVLPLLEGARERLSERAATRGIEIKIIGANDVPKVPGVDEELFQVFDNLISNAIKYGAEGSVVTVTAQTVERGVRIGVHNHGTPIPATHLPRLTERFYRVDKSRSRSLGGTGLGLAIVKHIVSRHRGTLLIDSSQGAGTMFSVDLPTGR